MSEVVRLDRGPPPAPAPDRGRGPWVIGVLVVMTVVAVGLLDAQSLRREQQRQEDATAFSVRLNPDGFRKRASELTLSVTLRNDGPVPVTVDEVTVGGLRSGTSPGVLAPGALRPVELAGWVDCAGELPSGAQVAVSLAGGDRTVDTVLPALDDLCAVLAEPLRVRAAAAVPVEGGLSVPLTLDNVGPDRLRLYGVRVRGTSVTLLTDHVIGTPDPVEVVALLPRSSTSLELRIDTPPSCRDLARFLDAPVAVLRYDRGNGTLIDTLRVQVDRTVLPDPHDVCG